MNLTKDTIKEVLLLTVVMTIFAMLGTTSLPYILVLLPAPFIVFNIKNNMVLGNISFIVLSFILSIILAPSLGVLYLIIFMPLIITMSYLIKRNKANIDNKELLFFSTIALFISILIIFAIANTGDISVSELIQNKINETIEIQVENLNQLDIKSEEIKEVEQALKSNFKTLFYVFPAILLLISFGISYINYKLVAMGLDRLDINILKPAKFRNFRLPSNFFMGIIIIYFAAYGLSLLNLVNNDIISSNILIIASFFILIQGLAVIDFILTKRNVFKVLKVLIMCIFIFMPTMISISYIIGVIDMIFNIRRL